MGMALKMFDAFAGGTLAQRKRKAERNRARQRRLEKTGGGTSRLQRGITKVTKATTGKEVTWAKDEPRVLAAKGRVKSVARDVKLVEEYGVVGAIKHKKGARQQSSAYGQYEQASEPFQKVKATKAKATKSRRKKKSQNGEGWGSEGW